MWLKSLLRVTVLLGTATTMGQASATDSTTSTRCAPSTVRPSASICLSTALMASCELSASTSTILSVATPTLYVFVKVFLPLLAATSTPREQRGVPESSGSRGVSSGSSSRRGQTMGKATRPRWLAPHERLTREQEGELVGNLHALRCMKHDGPVTLAFKSMAGDDVSVFIDGESGSPVLGAAAYVSA